MVADLPAELILIRHGPTERPTHLCGRTDVGLAAGLTFPSGTAAGPLSAIWVSPARRAKETATGMWPNGEFLEDPRLWEQDFGAWEDTAYAELPELPELSRAELADVAGQGGESFRDVVARVRPAIDAAHASACRSGPLALVCHAGVIRAALSIALENEEIGLAFEVAHFSATRLRCLSGGGFSVVSVNGALS